MAPVILMRGDNNVTLCIPTAFVFDTVEEIRSRKTRMFARAAADNTSMPPGPNDPPVEERELLAEWLACGAP